MEDIIHKHPRRWLQLKTLSNAIKYAVLILKGSSHNQVFASDPPEGVSGVRTSEVIIKAAMKIATDDWKNTKKDIFLR